MRRCTASLIIQFSWVQFSRSVMSDSLWPHESQHARPPCPSPTPGVYPNPYLSSCWCHPAVSSSVVPFSSCLQSLPASESFPMSQLFTWGGQSTGVSASALFSSVQFSCSVVSYSLRPHESQHARPPCPSPTPGVQSDSRPSSQWCHPAISSSVVPVYSCPQSLPASESFPMSQLLEKCRSKLQWGITSHGQTGHYQKSTTSKCWRGCGEERTLLHYWWGYKLVLPLWTTV